VFLCDHLERFILASMSNDAFTKNRIRWPWSIAP